MHGERDNLKYIYLMATATVVFWGVSFASVKTALSEASPFAVILLRFLMSLAVLAAAAAVRGELRLPSPHEAKILAVLGLWGFFFQLGVQTIAMETANSGTANWQMASSPALSAVFAAFFLNEKLSRRGIFGGLLAFAGVVVVLAFGKQGGGGSVAYNTGDFLITLSVVGWAAFMVLTRKLLRGGDFAPVFTLFWEMAFASAAAAIPVAISGSAVCGFGWQTWCAIMFLGCFCSGLAYIFWFVAASKIPVARLMFFQFLQPLIGIIAAYVMVGERFTLWLIPGGAMILSGVWIANHQAHGSVSSRGK